MNEPYVLRFTSPSGRGVASATVQRRGDLEFVEVEVSLLREMLGDLGFVEEHRDDELGRAALPLMPEPHVSAPHVSGGDRG